MIKINIKYSVNIKNNIPNKKIIKKWIKNIIKKSIKKTIITIKIVNKKTIKKLNYFYRKKNKKTNILSFSIINPKETNNKLLMGDLVICKSVVEKESKKYYIKIFERWAHIIIHGVLHLMGYSHNNLFNQKKMEKLEIKRMISLGFKNPYFYNTKS
ncbi:rRNA maturation RNase YbeY [Buchnera aphidicola]|uniref:rRNA maturation RNase YbeY n=1 Tax=Buchnera aphidicola TaxID=9 RepID=UPI00223734BB|nr:rRNA maturation RNase YbeY [Buchnera aphidicola]MCW5197547.1 rRNA maturation RNase YbeY [Buchnera aphidicola (Chaitophorus viminalis)]